MQYVKKHSLYIKNIKTNISFYVDKLGMYLLKHYKEGKKEYLHLSFDKNHNRKEAILELIYDEKHINIFPKKNDLEGYWKIAFSIKDVDIAREKLLKNNIKVAKAFQVPKIAYLCHFYDPNGYCIELIQHKFMKNHIKEKEDIKYALGNKAVFSLITYRVKDIKKSLDFYINKLQMKLLSKMDVTQRGFNLYFLAFAKTKIKNIEDTSIREELWQKPYTMIELQHILEYDKNKDFTYKVGNSTGFKGLSIANNKNETLNDPDLYNIYLEN